MTYSHWHQWKVCLLLGNRTSQRNSRCNLQIWNYQLASLQDAIAIYLRNVLCNSEGVRTAQASAVGFQMCPQIACLGRSKVAKVAFVWLFSAVCFQMCPQIAFPRRGKVALVASVWLFSTVRFQMSPQIACPRRGKVALVALVWLFSTVHFEMCPQIVCPRRGKVALVASVWLFSTVHF